MDEERSGPSSPRRTMQMGRRASRMCPPAMGSARSPAENADPDCADRTLSDEELAFICELEWSEWLLHSRLWGSGCGCANQEEEEEDRCARGFEHTDGVCDALCFPEDEDCLAIEDTCDDDYRYADGQCDEDCVFADPDCSTLGPDTVPSTSGETCAKLWGPAHRAVATASA